MKILFVYPRFFRHAQSNPELRTFVPMKEYLGSPSLAIAALVGSTPAHVTWEYRDDRLEDAARPTDADVVALTFFTAAASRGLELARYFRALGKKVVAGGIFPTMMPDEVQPHVDAVVVGEGEPVWARILDDVAAGTLQPRYTPGPADVATLAPPQLRPYFDAERGDFCPDDYPLQVSRGCPLTCQACALPTVMGKKMRALPMPYILDVAQQIIAGGRRACLTEDTGWLPGTEGSRRLLELLEHLAATGSPLKISYIGISMAMILAAPPRWFELARAAGVEMFYLVGGFDPVTMRAFTGNDERQLERAHKAIAKCFEADIEPYTSFLYGQDDDDVGTVDRMLEFARASGIRKAEFAIFTPYPGTPSFKRLEAEGRITSREWRRYNDANCVYQPKQLTADQVTEGYLRLWREFYADKSYFQDRCHDERTIQF